MPAALCTPIPEGHSGRGLLGVAGSSSPTNDRVASQVAQVVKNPPPNAGDPHLVSGLGKSPGGGHGNPLQYSCLENPMDRGAWWATAHGVTQSWKRLKQLSMCAPRMRQPCVCPKEGVGSRSSHLLFVQPW